MRHFLGPLIDFVARSEVFIMEHVFVCDIGGSYRRGRRATWDVLEVRGETWRGESVDEARERLADEFFSDPVNEGCISVEVYVLGLPRLDRSLT